MSQKSLLAVGIISFAVFAAGCNKQPQPEVTPEPAAEEAMLPDTSMMDVATLEGMHYQVDVAASFVQWSAQKAVVDTKHTGTVEISEGEIVLTPEKTGFVGARFVMDMTTIIDEDLTGKMKETLETHLKSDDFFSVATHPTATLVVTEAALNADGSYTMTGDLTIKGITHQVTFPATVALDGEELTASAELTIDRAKWDVRFGSDNFFEDLGDNLIDDQVRFEIEITAAPATDPLELIN